MKYKMHPTENRNNKGSNLPTNRPGIRSISIVIPVRDEVDNIIPLVEEIRKSAPHFGAAYEIIFINDHSEDGTENRIVEAQNLFAAKPEACAKNGVIHFIELKGSDPEGKEEALKAGFRKAGGDAVVTMDGDLQNDPADIPKMLEKLKECDLVCGIRTPRRDIWQKRVVSKIANWFRNMVTGDNIKDAGCALQAMRRVCVDKTLEMNRNLYGIGYLFLPLLLKKVGFSIMQLSVTHHERLMGRTKYHIFKNRTMNGIRVSLKICILGNTRKEKF
jgi:dolichol-phosphate mannosyltransferase